MDNTHHQTEHLFSLFHYFLYFPGRKRAYILQLSATLGDKIGATGDKTGATGDKTGAIGDKIGATGDNSRVI